MRRDRLRAVRVGWGADSVRAAFVRRARAAGFGAGCGTGCGSGMGSTTASVTIAVAPGAARLGGGVADAIDAAGLAGSSMTRNLPPSMGALTTAGKPRGAGAGKTGINGVAVLSWVGLSWVKFTSRSSAVCYFSSTWRIPAPVYFLGVLHITPQCCRLKYGY